MNVVNCCILLNAKLELHDINIMADLPPNRLASTVKNPVLGWPLVHAHIGETEGVLIHFCFPCVLFHWAFMEHRHRRLSDVVISLLYFKTLPICLERHVRGSPLPLRCLSFCCLFQAQNLSRLHPSPVYVSWSVYQHILQELIVPVSRVMWSWGRNENMGCLASVRVCVCACLCVCEMGANRDNQKIIRLKTRSP